MLKHILTALTSRQAIALVNLLLAFLMIQGVWDISGKALQIEAFQHHMEEILEGLGTIMVAFGVALEERENLMRMLGIYPAGRTPQQTAADQHCHDYGLFLLLVGLFVEVSVYIIRMPDIDTVDFDPALIATGAVLSVLGGLLLARLSWLLITMPANPVVQEGH